LRGLAVGFADLRFLEANLVGVSGMKFKKNFYVLVKFSRFLLHYALCRYL